MKTTLKLITCFMLLFIISLTAFAAGKSNITLKNNSLYSKELKNSYAFVAEKTKNGVTDYEISGKKGSLYHFDKKGNGSLFSGVYLNRYYESGKRVKEEKSHYECYSNHIYKVTPLGRAYVYIKNDAKSGKYQLLIDGKCYSVKYRSGSASGFTGIYKGRYYVKGELYSGSQKNILYNNYIYNVKADGSAAVKTKKSSGSYPVVISGVCLSVSSRSGKVNGNYSGLYNNLYYENGKPKISKKSFLIVSNGYVYKVSKKGKVSKYTDSGKGKSYNAVFDGIMYTVNNETSKADKYSGLYSDAQGKHYFSKGKPYTGSVTISGKDYYFGTNGLMVINSIAGGYYYDSTGVKCNDSAICCAVRFVNNHSSSVYSNAERLRICYNYMYRNLSYVRIYGYPGPGSFSSIAQRAMNTLTGNCYAFASAFAYVARVLGYDSGIEMSYIYRDNNWFNHGWTLVKNGGYYLICDPVKQAYGFNVYMKTKATSSLVYSSDSTKYYLTVKDGKAAWH